MFWGLIMEPKRRYTQKVKHPFHISMAALDIFSADDNPTQLMLHFEDRNYLLCTLQKGENVQCALDLNFEVGNEVVFATNGHSNVHLSGYLLPDDEESIGDEEEDASEEEEIVTTEIDKKRRKVGKSEEQPPKKKSKLEKMLDQTYDSEDDESFVLSEEMGVEEDSSADDDDDDIDDSDEDIEDEEIEEGASDDESSSMSDDEEEEEVKPKQNGVVSKKKAKQLQQNQQSPKATNKSPKNEKKQKPEKTPKQDKQQKQDGVQKSDKTPKGEKTPKGNKTPNQNQAKTPTTPNQQNSSPQKRVLEGGVSVQDLKVGEGQAVKPGKMVQVYYEGRLRQNNKVFDHNNKGSGFKFRIGRQEVIKGWDVGLLGMKIGGKRRIVCPPSMAYGNQGSPPVIPPNAALVFDVELKNIL